MKQYILLIQSNGSHSVMCDGCCDYVCSEKRLRYKLL